jgi:hypothetical protein
MPSFKSASPQISVRLFKTISRATVDGQRAASARYQGKDEFIDLTPFLSDGSAVRTSKSVRQAAGGFSIMFADKAQTAASSQTLESIYGLVEPMDGIEIRMWGGVGPRPAELPVIMRGFVSNVGRPQMMTDGQKPMRQVTITGQDYGKIWQMLQVIYLQAYSESKGLLTTYALWELFGLKAVNAMLAADFIKQAIDKIVNPFIDKMLPEHWPMPRSIKTDILVKRGAINNSYQNTQGSIYDILRGNADVPTWNELYIEDRQDGVYCVYRPIPALRLSADKSGSRKIQEDAPDPVYVDVLDDDVQSNTPERSDANVANFYWVNNTKYDLIDEMQRKLQSIPVKDKRVSQEDYPNSNAKYYGTRPMYAETVQADGGIQNMGSGQSGSDIEANRTKMESWIEKRGRELMEMNRDNVVYEQGSAHVKGGQMRADGKEPMKAGDYARFKQGNMTWDAYCVQIDHEFRAFAGYTQTIIYERGEGFANRIGMQSGGWLVEQASRGS